MSTLLFLLTFLLAMDDSEQLQTYIRLSSFMRANSEPFDREKLLSSSFDVSCEIFPKILTVGDVVYVKVATKNITQEPIEYDLRSFGFGNHSFITGDVFWDKSGSTGFGLGNSDRIELLPPFPIGTPTPGYPPKKTLPPDNTLVSGPQAVFVPPSSNYDRPFWAWDDSTDGERILFSFNSILSNVDRDANSILLSTSLHSVMVFQELKIKSRPKEELQLIKEWHEKTGFERGLRYDNTTSPDQWREFEGKLTPGTLRNYIRMIRTLVEIAQDESKGKRQEQFNSMLQWIDGLHPLEKEGLTKKAYEIVKSQRNNTTFWDEITIPQE